jgi:uncharacterized 2Fe-2S/4Fe-4S cluster protein (DUF4445 family)
MPAVRFLPQNINVDVPAGTLIHEAATRAGIHDVELPCGGEGSCRQCLVELADPERCAVMACQTRIIRDATVYLPDRRELAMRAVGNSQFLVDKSLLPQAGRLSPLYQVVPLKVPPASLEEHYSDWSRLVRALRGTRGGLGVRTSLATLRGLAGALRAQDGWITVAIEERDSELCVRAVEPGHRTQAAVGLAVDIGTTTVAAQLVDLNDGRVLATATSYNAQIQRGRDIISRIEYARTEKLLYELRGMVLETVHRLLAEMRDSLSLAVEALRAAFIVGNTTMIHLLLALPPRYIRESPYVPTVNPVPALTAREVGLEIHPDAVVEFAPGVGSYLGGDITAGLLATDLPKAEQVALFLDIGTNGEIVVGNAEWMVGCSCSAGPAFEGAGVQCGMRAAEGAIERIEISPDGAAIYHVIGGGKPAGICGSGLICLLGELFRAGIIDQSGRFHHDSRLFVVETGSRTATGEDLIVSESELENLIRTKAAIYAGCSLILDNVGLGWSDIARVYIAGGFGRYLRIPEAILIGLLPDLPPGRFHYIGNSALTGAYSALLSREHREKLAEIASRMTYVDLSSDPRYMDNYIQAMFLPHTDAAQFPSVAAIMENQRRNV